MTLNKGDTIIFNRAGMFSGLRVFVNENGDITTTIFIQFKNGMFQYKLQPNDYKKGFLAELIENYELGFRSNGVIFSYINEKIELCLECNAYGFNNDFVLEEFIKYFDKKEMILDLFDGFPIQAHCTFSLKDNPHTNFVPTQIIIGEDNDTDTVKIAFTTKLIKLKVMLADGIIISYSNSWLNEGNYGPQCYGGFERMDDNFIDTGIIDYDLSTKDYIKNQKVEWDENTFISLEGDSDSKINILLPLKNIHYILGIAESKFIQSGIQEDIEYLSQVEFMLHDLPYTLYLMSIDEIRDHFNGYREFLEKRRNTIYKTSEQIKGTQA